MHIPFVLVIMGDNYQVSNVQEHRTNPHVPPGSSFCISTWFARPSMVWGHLPTHTNPSHQPATHNPDRYQITPPSLCLCLCSSVLRAPPFWLPPLPTCFKAKPELHLLHEVRSLTQPLTPTKGSINASFCYFNIINP